MLHNTQDEIASISKAIFQLEKIFNEYDHIIKHLQLCKKELESFKHRYTYPTIKELKEFENKLYSSEIFNPKSTTNKNRVTRAPVIEEPLKSTTCDLIWTDSPPTEESGMNILTHAKCDAAYIRSADKLFYLNKETQEFTEIIFRPNRLVTLSSEESPKEIKHDEIAIKKYNQYNKILINLNMGADLSKIMVDSYQIALAKNQGEEINKNNLITVHEELNFFTDNTFTLSWLEDGKTKRKKILKTGSGIQVTVEKLKNNGPLKFDEIEKILSICDCNILHTVGITADSSNKNHYKIYWFEKNKRQEESLDKQQLDELLSDLNFDDLNIDQSLEINDPSIIQKIISKCKCSKNDIFVAYVKEGTQIKSISLPVSDLENIPSLLLEKSSSDKTLIDQVTEKFNCSPHKRKLAEFDRIVNVNNEEKQRMLFEDELNQIRLLTKHQPCIKIEEEPSLTLLESHKKKNVKKPPSHLKKIWTQISENQESVDFISSKLNNYIQEEFESKDKEVANLDNEDNKDKLFKIDSLNWDKDKDPPKRVTSIINGIDETIKEYQEKDIKKGREKLNELDFIQLSTKAKELRDISLYYSKLHTRTNYKDKKYLIGTESDIRKLITEYNTLSGEQLNFDDYYQNKIGIGKGEPIPGFKNNILYFEKLNKAQYQMIYHNHLTNKDDSRILTNIEYQYFEDKNKSAKDIAYIYGFGVEDILLKKSTEKINTYLKEIEKGIQKTQQKNKCIDQKDAVINKIMLTARQTYDEKIKLKLENIGNKLTEISNKTTEHNAILENLRKNPVYSLIYKAWKPKTEKIFYTNNSDILNTIPKTQINFDDYNNVMDKAIAEFSSDIVLEQIEAHYYVKLKQCNNDINLKLDDLDLLVTNIITDIDKRLATIKSDNEKVVLFVQYTDKKNILSNQIKTMNDQRNALINAFNSHYDNEMILAAQLWPGTFKSLISQLHSDITKWDNDLALTLNILDDKTFTIDKISEASIEQLDKASSDLTNDMQAIKDQKIKITETYDSYKQQLKTTKISIESGFRKEIKKLLADSIKYWKTRNVDTSEFSTHMKRINDQFKKFDQDKQTIQSILSFQEDIHIQLSTLQDSLIQFNRDQLLLIISQHENELPTLENLFTESTSVAIDLDLINKLPEVKFRPIYLNEQFKQLKTKINTSNSGLLDEEDESHLTNCIKEIIAAKKQLPLHELVLKLHLKIDKNHQNEAFSTDNEFFSDPYKKMKKDIIENAIATFSSNNLEVNDENINQYYNGSECTQLIAYSAYLKEKLSFELFSDKVLEYISTLTTELSEADELLLQLLQQSILGIRDSIDGTLSEKKLALNQMLISTYWAIRNNQENSKIGDKMERFLNAKEDANFPGQFGFIIPHRVSGNSPKISEITNSQAHTVLINKVKAILFQQRSDKKMIISFSEFLDQAGYYFNNADKASFNDVFTKKASPTPEQIARIQVVMHDIILTMKERKNKQALIWFKEYFPHYQLEITKANEKRHSFILAYQQLKIKLSIEHLKTQRRRENLDKPHDVEELGQFDLTSVNGIFKAMEVIHNLNVDDQTKLQKMGEVLSTACRELQKKLLIEHKYTLFNRHQSNLLHALKTFIEVQDLSVDRVPINKNCNKNYFL